MEKHEKKDFRFIRLSRGLNTIRRAGLLLAILLVGTGLSVSANASKLLQSKTVNISMHNVSILELFEEIKEQSNYSFFFDQDKINHLNNISLNRSDITVEEVLQEVLTGSGLTYTMVDDVIVLKEKEVPASKQQEKKTIKITGTVRSAETNMVIPGVSVSVKNSVLGTITDIDGKFTLNAPNTVEALEFSFIGCKTQEIQVKGRTVINVTMQQNIQELTNVVITGYEVIDKRELTSAISSIKADELDMTGALSVDRLLEGKAPGLMVTSLTTTPGAAAKIRVRGGSTFTGNQSPLWVIDGVIYEDPVPLSAEEINSFDNVNIIGNALTGLNPQDIDQIDVLKDASATAVYGTQAANGVIVITTKRGKIGKPSLRYSGAVNIVRPPSYLDMNVMNSLERIQVSREMSEKNLGFSTIYDNPDNLGYEGALNQLWSGRYNFRQFQDQVSYLETLNSDWFGELYRPAFNQTHSVSASGGSQNTRYYFSIGYDARQGDVVGVDLNRITARSNVDMDLRDNLLLSFKMSGSVQDATYNHSSTNAFNTAYYTSRTVPIYDQEGDYFFQKKRIITTDRIPYYGEYNILNELDNSEKMINNKSLTISAQLRWNFLRNFRLTSLLSYRNTTNIQQEWITEDTYFIARLRSYNAFEDMILSNVDKYGTVPRGGIFSAGMTTQSSYSIRNQLNYNKVFNEKHVFNFNLGQDARSVEFLGANGFQVPGYNHFQGRGFINLEMPSYNTEVPGSGLDFANYDYDNMISWLVKGKRNVYPTITDRVSNALSFLAIANYVYDNRYIFNFNMRSDGSNAFGQYQRYKFRPTWSVSGRWNIHNELFMKSGKWMNELALRTSYGLRGSMPNASPYLIIKDYGRYNDIYYPENVSTLSSFPNSNLRWERTSTFNLGLNFGFLDNRISGSFDYAYSKSTDLIQARPVSLVNGTTQQLYNAGNKDVFSYEFAIRTVNIKTKDFGWSTNFNFSYEKNRVLAGFEEGSQPALTINNYLNGSIYREGFPMSAFFSYRFDGLDEKGLPTFKHLVEENMTPEQQLEAMLVYEGSRVPLYYGGFGSNFRYKNFTLSASFSYKLGYKTRLLKLYDDNQNFPLPHENMNKEFVNRWREPGDEHTTNIPGLSNYRLRLSNTNNPEDFNTIYATNIQHIAPPEQTLWWMYDYSDARVVKADHIRLRALTASYRLPTRVLKGTGIKSLIVNVQADNLAVWSFDKRLKGQDPEQVNHIGLPSLPAYNLSLNVSF